MSTATVTIDETKAEAFGQRMVDLLNSGALALMSSIGHRTGLFDTLAELPPSTSGEIAEAARLNERYVREWLGAMVTGGVIDYDPATGTYVLPPEHAASLTRAAGPNNLALTTQFLPLLGSVESGIVESFRRGGGVPYEAFGRFHEVMAEQSHVSVCAALLDTTLPIVDGLVDRLHAGIRVLDAGCGRGRALRLMAEAFPHSMFTGYDFSEDAIAYAAAEAERQGLTNVTFAVRDVAGLHEPGRYDLITAFDSVHDQARPADMLRGIAVSLADDGVFLMQDIAASSHLHENLDHMLAPYLYSVSTMHCMTVSLAQGGEGLGTVWGKEKALEMLRDAGFTAVDVRQVESDILNYWYIARKG